MVEHSPKIFASEEKATNTTSHSATGYREMTETLFVSASWAMFLLRQSTHSDLIVGYLLLSQSENLPWSIRATFPKTASCYRVALPQHLIMPISMNK